MTIAVAVFWSLAALSYWVGYRRGQQGEREQQAKLDAAAEHNREIRDEEIRNLPDVELDDRLDRWMRNGPDSRR